MQKMPKFYFDVMENDQLTFDQDGLELEDADRAHREAIKTIADMAAEKIPLDGALKLTVAVADEKHRILFRTQVSYEPGKLEQRKLK